MKLKDRFNTPGKISAAGIACCLAFGLGFSACLAFMTVSFPAEPKSDTEVAGTETESGTDEKEQSGDTETPVLVIDAGHGGFDGGAEAADGTQEKQINLAIAQQLAELAEEYEVDVIMTREDDGGLYSEENKETRKREDLLKRKKIMEDSGAVLVVSIHLNSFPQNSSVYGAQVFYSSDEQPRTEEQKKDSYGSLTSQEVAETVQESLETSIPDGGVRSAMKKGDILLFEDPSYRIILVECGFLSNPQEAEKLKTAEYQQKLAAAIWEGINEKLCLEVKKDLPVIDSANK